MTYGKPNRKRTSSLVSFDDDTSPNADSNTPKNLRRFTLTSKPNWWLVEIDEENRSAESFDSDETAVHPDKSEYQSPITSPTQFNKRAASHPTQLFQFPTPPAYSAPPNPTSHLSPVATGSTSELFKCIIKKPDVVELEINGELQSNVLDVRQQFLAELRVYRTVTRHRNIVAFLGCLEGLGMVLEYVDGSTLLDVIRNPEFPLGRETKIDFHNQLLDGLAHVHSFGLSHGDLSLLNVHVTHRRRVLKIFDFGRSTMSRTHSYPHQLYETSFLSKHIHKRSKSYNSGPTTPTLSYPSAPPKSTIFSSPEFEDEQIHPGTRPFTAPEILRSESSINALLADAYSFGMILLCLDLSQLVDLDPEYQKNDGKIDVSACEILGERIDKWYCVPSGVRRAIKAGDQMGSD